MVPSIAARLHLINLRMQASRFDDVNQLVDGLFVEGSLVGEDEFHLKSVNRYLEGYLRGADG